MSSFTICNVLSIVIMGSSNDLTARIISNLCDLNELKSNNLHEDTSDVEIDFNEIN